MLPMFMFSATFYPITVYPDRDRVDRTVPRRCTTGWSSYGRLTTGTVGPFQLVNVAYLTGDGIRGALALRAAHRQAAAEVI